MGIEKALKMLNLHFDDIYSPNSSARYKNGVFGKNTSIEVVWNHGWYGRPYSLKIEWFPPQDRYNLIIELYSTEEFMINTWNLSNSASTWNSDFIIPFDIEESYFDCLNTVYPMTSNFKFKYFSVLKSISTKYMEKKKLHKIN